MKNKFRILLAFFLILFPFKSLALIEVDITRGNLSPLPVAVSSLSTNEKDREDLLFISLMEIILLSQCFFTIKRSYVYKKQDRSITYI